MSRQLWLNKRLRLIILIILTITLVLSIVANFTTQQDIYRIYFDSDGGSECQHISVKGKQTIVLPSPLKDGYIFKGWYFDKGSWERELKASSFSKKRLNDNVTVYAKWEFYGYKITFETNGGSDVEDIILDIDEAISHQPFTEKEGYTFLGWYIDKTLSILYELGTPINKSMTLYAKWIPVEEGDKVHYTVTFITNGGQQIEPIQVLEGDSFMLPQAIRVGYVLLGWYLDESFSTLYPAGNIVASNIILYAKWERDDNFYKVTLNANGGIFLEDNNDIIEVFIKRSQRLEPPAPVRTGYQFLWWCNDENLTQIFDFDLPIQTDINVYAKWEEILPQQAVYTITFNTNGGEHIGDIECIENEFFTPPPAHREGYNFVGWYIDEALTQKYEGSIITESFILYADWEEAIEDVLDGGFIYSLAVNDDNQEYYTIKNYAGNSDTVIIPESYDSIPITKIADEAFMDTNITTVSFSNNISDIGISAFEGTKIVDLELPDTIKFIDRAAFRECDNLITVTIMGYPQMASRIFESCDNLKTVNLASNTQKIADRMFNKCITLERITLPNSCEEIGDFAFEECRFLYEVIINTDLQIIGNGAFAKCYSLSEIDLANVENIGKSAFQETGLKNINLPDSVQSLGGYVFENCNKLETVVIGANLEALSYTDFFVCKELKSFSVSLTNEYYKSCDNNLYTKNGEELIRYAPKQEYTLFVTPNEVVKVHDYAFSYTNNLETIKFNKNVTTIGYFVFINTDSIEEFIINEENEYFCSIDGVIYNKDITKLVSYPTQNTTPTFEMPDTVIEVCTSAFMGAKYLEKIKLSNSLKKISDGAFYQCSLLSESSLGESPLSAFSFPESLVEIGQVAFAHTAIVNLIITNNISAIGMGAFSDCSELIDVRIGGTSLSRLESGIFDNCENLQKVHFLICPEYIGNVFNNCENISLITIRTSGQPEIVENAFEDCLEKPDLRVTQENLNYYEEIYSNLFSEITVGPPWQ